MPDMDFYIILGLERGATLGDIKRAYKRLARRYHPDINPGDRTAAAQFRQIAEAYETLSDPDRRRRYDATGAPADASSERRRSASRGSTSRSASSGASASTFGDLFADVLQQRDGATQDGAPERGADLHQSVTLELRGGDARRPAQVVTVTRQEHCRDVPAARVGCTRRRDAAVRTCHGSGHRQVGARAHGVLEAVRAVRRHPDASGRRAARPAAASRSRCAPRR